MAIELSKIRDLAHLAFDDIIDVRSPAEFAEDHIPGAINLPVLDNEERARVGTIYKQVSPFDGRKIGAALVAKNAALHLQGALSDRPGGWRPLIYCWRGGQRSGSFASILSQIGWRAQTITGGYKSWRGLVVAAVHQAPAPSRICLLDGNTGTAKTEILHHLRRIGLQILDLEALAEHRGSLFGHQGPQPSQKTFESRLALALADLDPAKPVVIEAESAKVGECRLPGPLWHAMRAAPRVAIDAPAMARAAYLVRAYQDVIADPDRLSLTIERLRHAHAREQIAAWGSMVAQGHYQDLAQSLMQLHYDPRYHKHRSNMPPPAATITAPDLTPSDVAMIADKVAQAVADLPAPGGASETNP